MIDAVRDVAEVVVETGNRNIAVLPDRPRKDLLEQVGDFFINRGA